MGEVEDVDRCSVFAVMATRPYHRSSREAFQSFMLGAEAWPGYPPGPAQHRASRALKGLRRKGLVECLSSAGLWRLTEAGEVAADSFRRTAGMVNPRPDPDGAGPGTGEGE